MNKKIDFAAFLISSVEDDCAFDQPCAHGYRVDGHSVYCCNEKWEKKPRKCHQTWFTGGEEKDEECSGFEPNPKCVTKSKEGSGE